MKRIVCAKCNANNTPNPQRAKTECWGCGTFLLNSTAREVTDDRRDV